MAADVDLAKDLVAKLTAQQLATPFSKPILIIHSFDEWIESDKSVVTKGRIRTDNVTQERIARGIKHWFRVTTLRMTIEAEQQVNTTVEEPTTQDKIGEWISLVDEIQERIKTVKPLGKTPTRFNSAERYDADALQTSRIFRSTFTIVYPNV